MDDVRLPAPEDGQEAGGRPGYGEARIEPPAEPVKALDLKPGILGVAVAGGDDERLVVLCGEVIQKLGEHPDDAIHLWQEGFGDDRDSHEHPLIACGEAVSAANEERPRPYSSGVALGERW